MNSPSIMEPMTAAEVLQERLDAITSLLTVATNATPERLAELRGEARELGHAIQLLDSALRFAVFAEPAKDDERKRS